MRIQTVPLPASRTPAGLATERRALPPLLPEGTPMADLRIVSASVRASAAEFVVWMAKAAAAVLAALVMFASEVGAQEVGDAQEDLSYEEARDQFELYNQCQPIRLTTLLSDDADDIGLTEARLQTLVESRLRAARLYNETALRRLIVSVDVLSLARGGAVYSTTVQFQRQVVTIEAARRAVFNALSSQPAVLELAQASHTAPTWERGSVGTTGGGPDFILQGVSALLDEFILEYLRVNEEACGGP